MSIYIPISSVSAAKKLSKSFFDLSVPDSEKQNFSISQYLFEWVVHPDTGQVYLELKDQYYLPIHLLANENILDTILNPFILAGKITEIDKINARTAIKESKEKKVDVASFIPAFWLNQAKSREQLKSEGFFGID